MTMVLKEQDHQKITNFPNIYILLGLALFDTLDFLLNEYFDELNTANFNILNKFFNWILSKKITNE